MRLLHAVGIRSRALSMSKSTGVSTTSIREVECNCEASWSEGMQCRGPTSHAQRTRSGEICDPRNGFSVRQVAINQHAITWRDKASLDMIQCADCVEGKLRSRKWALPSAKLPLVAATNLASVLTGACSSRAASCACSRRRSCRGTCGGYECSQD